MNVRLVVLAALLAILSVVGFVQFKGSEPRANLPATLSPLARPSRRVPPGSPEVRVAGVMINSPTHTGADPASGDGFGVDLTCSSETFCTFVLWLTTSRIRSIG